MNSKSSYKHFLPGLLITISLFSLIAVVLMTASGCDGDQTTTSTGTTGTITSSAKTNFTSTAAAMNTNTSSAVETPPAPAPSTLGDEASTVPLKIVDYAVDPNTVHAGAPLTCMVTVEGTATAVSMGLTGPSGSTSQTVSLIQGTTVGGVTNWTATVAAPTTPGGWRFGATAVATDGTEVIPDAGGLSASLLPFEIIP